ncbi:hypothetical protein GGE35_004110 [Rhizobium cellulosilyticum]|uniref:Uncharacterized protein n=1 Tax=Aliirhizobium cellulosilyticum TaxID=393664 RepID=A0A7W6V1J6_9HYPH|nr:hypothetical protein [Rhizobium cellulosilyticum]MBB4413639.1 hypothetical protein [Rhizobium cellulosilyticum]MBB4448273.1 hypothetical protein [Rhizobium cellulosilyticum]
MMSAMVVKGGNVNPWFFLSKIEDCYFAVFFPLSYWQKIGCCCDQE